MYKVAIEGSDANGFRNNVAIEGSDATGFM